MTNAGAFRFHSAANEEADERPTCPALTFQTGEVRNTVASRTLVGRPVQLKFRPISIGCGRGMAG
jgi:hypothetical protein